MKWLLNVKNLLRVFNICVKMVGKKKKITFYT